MLHGAKVEVRENDKEYPILIDSGEGHGIALSAEDAMVVYGQLKDILVEFGR